jgi:hypothetical protein
LAAEPEANPPPNGLDRVYFIDHFSNAAVERALDAWKQGDLVTGVPFFWATRTGDDELTRLIAEDPGTDHLPVVTTTDNSSATFAVITSQTCDIGAVGQGRLHPTVQVCPLLRLEDSFSDARIAEIKLGKVGYLAPITDPPTSGTWAADLRISLPVSKVVLLDQVRRSCFAREVEALQFGEHVASRYVRPALHDAISDGLVTGLRNLVEVAQKENQWPDKIEQFRLCVVAGERLEPKRVQIYAVMLDPLTSPEQQPLRTWRKAENKRLRKSAGIEIAPVRFIKKSQMTAIDHRESCQLHVPELGMGTYP